MAYNPDCDFCQIARGKRDEVEVVAEGEGWVAFFPFQPATAGHTLVIPNEHVKDLWEANSAVGERLIVAAMDLGKAIKASLDPDGLNLITSSGKAAEQTVPHLHLHVVPRWSDDGFGEIWPPKTLTSRAVKHDVADRIRKEYAQL
jgi:diadenosine tetraphosphate (Ap4A) HIT family hydrolase